MRRLESNVTDVLVNSRRPLIFIQLTRVMGVHVYVCVCLSVCLSAR